MQKVDSLIELDNVSLAKYLSKVFGISCQAGYDILSNKEKILKFYTNSDSNEGIINCKRMREEKLAKLDAILFEWFKQRCSENMPITEPMMYQKAKELHRVL